MKIASQLARDILAMEDEIDFLRGEVARLEGYRQKYEDLLACSVSYSERMIGGLHQRTGPTPLTAAMRCFVASKLGGRSGGSR